MNTKWGDKIIGKLWNPPDIGLKNPQQYLSTFLLNQHFEPRISHGNKIENFQVSA
jgi:hypothetical protein